MSQKGAIGIRSFEEVFVDLDDLDRAPHLHTDAV
jgi:hypothetical protein